MSSTTALALLSVIASVSARLAVVPESDFRVEFEQYMKDFYRTYSGEELEQRFVVFSQVLQQINEYHASADEESPELGLNEFSDRFPDELRGLRTKSFNPQGLDGGRGNGNPNLDPKKPNKGVDYSNCYNDIPVSYQRKCGSCWAISTSAAITGAFCKAKGSSAPLLSAQDLVDCDKTQHGCDGASELLEPALFVKKNGICSEKTYAYEDRRSLCRSTICYEKYFGVVDAIDISMKGAQALVDALEANGPVVIGIHSADPVFANYKTGVINSSKCKASGGDHAITLIGYKVDPKSKKPIFRVRNSWGISWGEKGYGWMEFNACNLGCMIVSPIVDKSKGIEEQKFMAEEAILRV